MIKEVKYGLPSKDGVKMKTIKLFVLQQLWCSNVGPVLHLWTSTFPGITAPYSLSLLDNLFWCPKRQPFTPQDKPLRYFCRITKLVVVWWMRKFFPKLLIGMLLCLIPYLFLQCKSVMGPAIHELSQKDMICGIKAKQKAYFIELLWKQSNDVNGKYGISFSYNMHFPWFGEGGRNTYSL